MRKKLTVTLFIIGIFAIILSDQALSEKYQLFRIDFSDKAEVKQILSSGIDVEAVDINYDERFIEAGLSSYDAEIMRKAGFKFTIVIPDLEKYYAERFDGKSMGGFLTFSEYEAKIDSLENQYPDILKVDSLGLTEQGRNLYAIKISDNVYIEEDEPEVFINGLIHAREPIGGAICIDFAEWLCSASGSDPVATDIVENRQVWIMPVVNPDGYVYNETTHPNGGGWWRKSRRDNGNGSYGVDNNRNFTYNWGWDDYGSSPDPWTEIYRGPYAGSEPENQAIMQLCEEHFFQVALHYHSFGGLFLYAWGYEDYYPDDLQIIRAIADSAVTFNHYKPGTNWQNLYNTNGDAVDYSYGERDTKNMIFGYIVEVGDDFWPEPDSIPMLVETHRQVNIFFSQIADNPWRLIPPIAPQIDEMTTDDDGNFTVNWDVIQGDSVPIKYQLQEVYGAEDITDGAEEGETNWLMEGFYVTDSGSFNGEHSFYSGDANYYHSTMTSITPYPVTEPTDLTFSTFYDIEYEYDYAFVEISTDGYNFTALDTLTGYSWGWLEKSYPLDDYIGEQIYLRFRYDTDVYAHYEGFYIDDVSPVRRYDTVITVNGELSGESYDIVGKLPGTHNYRVRGYNESGWGIFGNTEDIVVTGALPDMQLAMEPVDPPIVAPPGGSFEFNAIVSNNENFGQYLDGWIGLRLPDQSCYGPLVVRSNFYFEPQQTRTFSNAIQNVPIYAPAGDYTYIACMGDYPTVILDSAYFEFTVTDEIAASGVSEWLLEGWTDAAITDISDIPLHSITLSNYPNPFNAQTTIKFSIQKPVYASLKVYNLAGQLVETLYEGCKNSGEHAVDWDASNYSSGVYFYKLQTNGMIVTNKMNLLK